MHGEPGVTVWKINLHHLNPDQLFYYKYISDDEIEKSRRFYFEKDQRRFVQSHAILRMILAEIIKIPPRNIEFLMNPFGKPYIMRRSDQPEVFFNLSHSEAGVLIAVSEGYECGVDIEYQKEDIPSREIAGHFFSENELKIFLALPQDQQKEAFFNCWTRKEAFIKAKGKGLSIPLDSFDVSLAPDEPARLLQSRLESDDIQQWFLVHLETWYQYSAALCVHNKRTTYHLVEWA
jgi:4'-phosphopantetheinyl transferase